MDGRRQQGGHGTRSCSYQQWKERRMQVVWQGAAAQPEGKKREKGSSRTKQSSGTRRCRCGFQHCRMLLLPVLLWKSEQLLAPLRLLLLLVHCYIIHGAFLLLLMLAYVMDIRLSMDSGQDSNSILLPRMQQKSYG